MYIYIYIYIYQIWPSRDSPITYEAFSLAHVTVAILASNTTEAGAYALLHAPVQDPSLEFAAMPTAAVWAACRGIGVVCMCVCIYVCMCIYRLMNNALTCACICTSGLSMPAEVLALYVCVYVYTYVCVYIGWWIMLWHVHAYAHQSFLWLHANTYIYTHKYIRAFCFWRANIRFVQIHITS
jgi:hypothetical protein